MDPPHFCPLNADSLITVDASKAQQLLIDSAVSDYKTALELQGNGMLKEAIALYESVIKQPLISYKEVSINYLPRFSMLESRILL